MEQVLCLGGIGYQTTSSLCFPELVKYYPPDCILYYNMALSQKMPATLMIFSEQLKKWENLGTKKPLGEIIFNPH